MKSPKENVPARKCRSFFEQKLERKKFDERKDSTHVKKDDKLDDSLPNFHKSETNINRYLKTSEDPQSDTNGSDPQLIPVPMTPKQPKETLKKSLIILKSTRWNECVSALRDIVQISRFNPQLLKESMPVIYRGIIMLLKSLRPSAIRTACQAANELFMNMPTVQGLEFEELVQTLLQKTADTNISIRNDALEALDSMVIHVSPVFSIRTLLHKKVSGYDPTVRATAAKLLACIVHILGTDSKIEVNEETKISLVHAAVRFSQDQCNSIRFYGMQMMTMLMHQNDNQNILQKKVSIPVLEKVNKILESVRDGIGPKKI